MISSELTNDQIIDLISDYKNFKRIIEASVPEDDRRRNQNRHNRNKDLTKLSNVQLWQLTTDVNDELMKRLTDSGADASLNDLDLKRGKAQSKLSRLKDAKFHKLILDIFTEIERRNLHHLDMGTHNNGLDEGDLNFYLNDSLFESFKINDDFMSVNGIISIEVFRELKTQFTLYFQNTLHRIDPVDTTTTRLPILLETIIKIAKLIGDLLPVLSSVSLQSSLENEIVYLKSALSHAFTSTRYFLTYGDLIPRIVAQSSISEVIFAFCNIAPVSYTHLDVYKRQALIHSRVRRVVFLTEMQRTGSLKLTSGDGYCMNDNKQLNSTYEAFQWIGEEYPVGQVDRDVCC